MNLPQHTFKDADLANLASFQEAVNRLGAKLDPLMLHAIPSEGGLWIVARDRLTQVTKTSVTLAADTNITAFAPSFYKWLEEIRLYNAVVNQIPLFTAQIPKVDPSNLDPTNWVPRASTCLFIEDGQFYNLVRLHTKTRAKPRRKGERTDADDLKVKVYFTVTPQNLVAFAKAQAQDPSLSLTRFMRYSPINIPATKASIATYIRDGKHSMSVLPVLEGLFLNDRELHHRMWMRPVNATKLGEFEHLEVVPMLKVTPKVTPKKRGPSNEAQPITVPENGKQVKYVEVEPLALQNPKTHPGFLLRGSRGARFFYSADDPTIRVQLITYEPYPGGTRIIEGEFAPIPAIDSFAREKIGAAVQAYFGVG